MFEVVSECRTPLPYPVSAGNIAVQIIAVVGPELDIIHGGLSS